MRASHQWVKFSVHAVSQPDVPCGMCGEPATWLLLEWTTEQHDNERGRHIEAKAYCPKHAQDQMGE